MKWFKRILIAVLALGLLLGVGIAILLFAVDPNAYKAPLAEQVKQRYNRTLRIDGDLKLAVFPRLGLSIGRASLTEPASDQVFAALDSAKVSVALWPLLSREVVIDHVDVTGLKANLVRNRDGRLSFADLMGQTAAPATTPVPVPVPGGKEKTPLQIDIAGVSIAGEVAWRDDQAGTQLLIEKLQATTGRIAPGRPFDVNLSARVLGQAPKVDATLQLQTNVEFDAGFKTFAARKLDFKLAGSVPDVRANALSVRGSFGYDVTKSAFDATNLSVAFQGDVAGRTPLTGIDARIEAQTLSAAPADGKLTIDRLTMAASGKAAADAFDLTVEAPGVRVTGGNASGDSINGRVKISGSRALDAKFTLAGLRTAADVLTADPFTLEGSYKQAARSIQFKVATPVSANWRAGTVALDTLVADLRIDDPALPNKSVQVPANGMLRVDTQKQHVEAKLGATLEGSKLDATLDANSFSAPRVVFSLVADKLDLDKLVPPKPVMTVPAPIVPPVAPAATPAGTPAPAPAVPAAPAAVDFSPLHGITASGTVRVGSLVARNIKARDVSVVIKVADGRVDLSGMQAALYDGRLTGSAFADANGNRLGINAVLADVSIQPLLVDLANKDLLSGRGRLSLALQTSGQSTDTMKKRLDGNVQVALRDGAVKGINLAQSLRDFKAMIGRKQDDAQQNNRSQSTDFSQLDARLDIAQGVGTLNQLDLRAPLLRLSPGKPARIDLAANQFDLVVNTNVVNTSKGQGGADLDALREVTVPVHLTGPIEAPAYRIMWADIGGAVLKNAVQEAIEKRLGGSTGGGQEKLEERLKDSVGERLKGLLGR
ncbi:AsmA family protein [Pigmentiphaga aceris]|nr:AsmA family protein [Pigmentiphaga aceris]